MKMEVNIMKRLKVNKTPEELELMLKSNPDYLVGIRLLSLIQIVKGLSSRKLEDIFYKSHSRFCAWVNNFNKLGIEGLRDKPRSGRKPKLTKSELARIKKLILEEKPTVYGYNTGTWTGPIVINWIKKNFDKIIKKATIYVLFKKSLGLSHQKGKGFYPEINEEERNQFKETLKKTKKSES
jgi:transposase